MKKLRIIEIELKEGEIFDANINLTVAELRDSDIIRIVETELIKKISYVKHRNPTVDIRWYAQ